MSPFRNAVENVSYQTKEDWTKSSPECCSISVFKNRLQNSKENTNSAIQYDKDSITLYTDDETDGLEAGCIVVYRYSPWIVDGVQRKFHIKETEFSQKEHCTTIITLRK